MPDDEVAGLRDRVYGLSAVVSMLMAVIDKDEEIHQRLLRIEGAMRQENAPSATIEIVKACRIVVGDNL